MRQLAALSCIALVCAALLGPLPVRTEQARPPGSPPDAAFIADLVAANRILVGQGVLDGYGHVSARLESSPARFFLARSRAPELVTSADILEYDLDSAAIDAKGRALYSERFIHGEIYKARPDVRAIVHNHSPSVIPFGVSTMPLRPVYHMAAFIGDRLPVFDIRKTSGMTDMLVSSNDRGRALAQALGSSPAVLMRGHGVAVVGSSVPIAVGRSIYLETNARLQQQAMALGGPVTYLDPEEARQIVATGEYGGYARAWELWRNKAQLNP
jgi:HCOMODA/2-hydroxy-3-carboxy-muconic semialdehyde decarboxylase